MFDLTRKRALITGSTQGIGKAIAACFVKYGADVIVHGAESIEKVESAAKETGAKKAVVFDLENNDIGSLFEKTGAVDILVLNASVQFRTKWSEIPGKEFDKQVAVNLKSTIGLMQMYEPHMEEKGWGRILTIGSVQQYRPHKDMAVYAATKAAVMNFVQNIAKQVADKGITVNNISPGVIKTPRNEVALFDKEYRKLVLSGVPMGKEGLSDDIAGAALLLCSDSGRYITGTDLIVDGGMHL